MRLPGAGPAGRGARSGVHPHLAGHGGRSPQPSPEPRAPRPSPRGARDSSLASGAPAAPSPGGAPGAPPRVPELRPPRRPHGPPRILLGFPWSACVRITWEVFEKYRSRGAPPRTCDREPAGGAPERASQSLCPGGLRRAPASGQRLAEIPPALRAEAGVRRTPQYSCGRACSLGALLLPTTPHRCGGSRAGSRRRGPRSPPTPAHSRSAPAFKT